MTAAYWEYAKASFPQLKELLAIPNDAHFPKEIERNVQWCEQHFTRRGFSTLRLETPGAPLLLAERKTTTKGAKTVLIYLQVDGQPVDPKFWNQEDPYTATLKKRTADGVWEPMDWDRLASSDIDPGMAHFCQEYLRF